MHRPQDLINLTRYPLMEPEGAVCRALVREGQGRLAGEGALALPGFVTREAVALMRAEAEALLSRAYFCAQGHNPYLVPDDPALAPTHPRNRRQTSDKGCLADDLIPGDSALRALYDWPGLRRFIAAVLGAEALYPYEDPLGSLNINVFEAGQQLGWHFDNADFAVTLMIQPAQAGGIYEYVPAIRSPDSENFDAVGRALDGGRDGVQTLDMDAGALVLFRGRTALHRVTPVEGARPRLIAVLSYDTRPGVTLTEHTRRIFYGRAA
jgi:hypothetical protein